ncbi:TlpA disulfide reductase family protein [Sphingomonas sp. 3-13AW]|uniref:TlpA disulfide reductase family protein n=1 Tax=Sphingomonas sp. 3-13AW TaxID=3050450 RepID=UPI003BB68957
MRKVVFYMMLAGSCACLSACDRQAEPTVDEHAAKAKEAINQDPELAKKVAEMEAKLAKLTPAEKAKLAAESKKMASTLPMPLTEIGPIKVRPAGKAETSLATIAPVGTPTVIAAWASWCIPCKIEARELAGLSTEYGSKLNIVYLNIGTPEVERVKGPEFLRETGAEQLGLTMLAAEDFLKLTRLDQLAVPRVLVFDRTGKPIEVIVGASASGRDPRLTKAIEKVLL